MPDIPTLSNGGLLIMVGLVLVAVVLWLLTLAEPPLWGCVRGHMHTDADAADACDLADWEARR